MQTSQNPAGPRKEDGIRRAVVPALMAGWILLSMVSFAAESPSSVAKSILDISGVKGGLVVHLGVSDGNLTAALRCGPAYLVHGLAANAEARDLARRQIDAAGCYGPVSVDLFTDGRLPYIDNLVNLIVLHSDAGIDRKELLRVLAPGGVVVRAAPGGGEGPAVLLRKQWPAEIDEWTHFMHGPGNNAVAADKRVGPPRHLQWASGPRWARHHDRMGSLSAMVSAAGRVFYIFDHGPTSAIVLPPRWKLVARDAFNGTKLWEREIPDWHPHLWPMKSGSAQLPRRLVAHGERVYAVPGREAPLSCLDAATGKLLRTYRDTRSTEEVILSRGTLFVLVNDRRAKEDTFRPVPYRDMWDSMRRVASGWPWDGKPRRLRAVDARTGEMLWEHKDRVAPLTLAANDEAVFFHNGRQVVCLDRGDGRRKWTSEPAAIEFPLENVFAGGKRGREKWAPAGSKVPFIPASFAPTLVVNRQVVLFAGGDRMMSAFCAREGKTLWTGKHEQGGHFSPQDLLVIDGLVWSGAIARAAQSGQWVGRDLRTGRVKRTIDCETGAYFMHQRCYRNKATERFFITGRTGTEFIDLKTGRWDINHWVRGGCIYGMMPCNGLLYSTPHSCACYMLSKLSGMNALAPDESAANGMAGEKPAAGARTPRLIKGPAYGRDFSAAAKDVDAWPNYRCDNERRGFLDAELPDSLKQTWRAALGGRLSAVTVAAGRLFVAQVDRHTVHALDARTGKPSWSFTAAARVDSPPTIWKGRCFFGSRDGNIYCLDASSGELVWQLRAGPAERRLAAYGQLESPWPVHGSVMIHENVLYTVAGRSMFIDGGIRFLKVNPVTGMPLKERVYDSRSPDGRGTLQDRIKARQMATALPDILSTNGRNLFMRNQRFDMEGVRIGGNPKYGFWTREAAFQGGEAMHLMSPTGFLDGSWWHRSYWIYGRQFVAGALGYSLAGRHAPAGRILVMDGERVYGFGRKSTYYRWTTPMEYRLFAASRKLHDYEMNLRWPPRSKKVQKLPSTRPVRQWSRQLPVLVRGLVATRRKLFIAGPPDVFDEQKSYLHTGRRSIRLKAEAQVAAMTGLKGASLWIVQKSTGKPLGAWELGSPPVWDGLAAAYGRLYVAHMDGSVSCLGPEGKAMAAQEVAEPGYRNPHLLGHWKMDEGRGMELEDSSERGNHAYFNGRWTGGKRGSGIRLATNRHYAYVPDNQALSNARSLTLAAWVKADGQSKAGGNVVQKRAPNGGFNLAVTPKGELVAAFWNGDQRTAARTGEVLSDKWHHVAVTNSGARDGKIRIYVDGAMKHEREAVPLGSSEGSDLFIAGSGRWFLRGVVDELRVYDRELGPEEIKSIMNVEAADKPASRR